MKNEKSNGLLKGCYGWFIIVGICIATGAIFSRISNRKEKERDAELNYEREIEDKVREWFGDESCAPYLDRHILRGIMGGEERYEGNVCDIFPAGDFYLINLKDLQFGFEYNKGDKHFKSDKWYKNEITIYCWNVDIKEETKGFLMCSIIGCDYINYKRSSKASLQALSLITYQNADSIQMVSEDVCDFVQGVKNNRRTFKIQP